VHVEKYLARVYTEVRKERVKYLLQLQSTYQETVRTIDKAIVIVQSLLYDKLSKRNYQFVCTLKNLKIKTEEL
jgi:hypothetical protein